MKNFLQRFVDFTLQKPVLIVVAVLVLTVISALWLVLFKPLKLDTNFASLLPDDLPCVVESRRVSKLVGSTDYLYIAIESKVPADNKAFADDIAKKLKKLKDIDWVATKEDKSFFRKRRLLYLDTPDLAEIVKRAGDRVRYEKKIANPFYISIDDEQPPDISFDDIMEKYETRLSTQGAKGVMETEKKNEKKTFGSEPESEPEPENDFTDYIASPDGTLFTVMARPSKPATDMDFGRKLVEQVQRLIDSTHPKRNSSMKVEVAGSYRNRYLEYNNIVKDIFSSIGVSIALILLIIVVFFRRVRSLLLIVVPLLCGITLSVALTALTLGRLNMVTALIFAVLLGLGIDFGVHMTTRYLDERGRGKSLNESLRLALLKTGRAIVTAGLTTAAGLGVLVLAEFKGFSEFGIIATMGILTCLLTYILLVPAMATLMEKVSVPKPWRKKNVMFEPAPVSSHSLEWALLLCGIFAFTAVSAYWGSQVGFQYNFRELGSKKKVSTKIKYGKTLSQSSSPVVAVVKNRAAAERLTRYLEKRKASAENKKSLLKNVFSIFTFIPDDQDAKLKLLAELREYVDDALALRKLKQKTRTRLEEISEWTQTEKITVENMPDWVKGKFTQKDGTLGTMVYLFPTVNEFMVDDMARFYDEFDIINAPGVGKVRPTASGFILVEVIRAVQRDGVMMTIVASIAVLLLLLLDLRSFKGALITFVPLLIGLTWTAGMMHLLDMKLGLYNMLVLPMLLGIGIDASVHLYHSYREFGAGSLPYVFRTTGIAVFVASATTGVGFVGMMIVSHNGLRTIGNLAIAGTVTSLVGSLLTLFVTLSLFESLKKRKQS
ncbi:MAG: MMPL family transporter [Deltaproteobacteria bacterium]|nr:MMPL family transporter [Deltaproteobacteria bacterium]MBN2672773.1 MMPL family transporter [Deltaproteobacteria bacterium]